MSDPTKAEPRNSTVGGETAQETADRMAGSGRTGMSNPPHPSAALAPTKQVGPSTHPSAPSVYGPPMDTPILGQRNGT